MTLLYKALHFSEEPWKIVKIFYIPVIKNVSFALLNGWNVIKSSSDSHKLEWWNPVSGSEWSLASNQKSKWGGGCFLRCEGDFFICTVGFSVNSCRISLNNCTVASYTRMNNVNTSKDKSRLIYYI